jgi:hypothetical protein
MSSDVKIIYHTPCNALLLLDFLLYTLNIECPLYPGENVELMLLNLDEKYEYHLEPNKGLEIKFWINEEMRDLESVD